MNKEEIFDKLNNLNLDKNKYIVTGLASLVCQDIIDSTSNIVISCDKDYSDNINLDNCFKVNNSFYNIDNIIIINGYRFANLILCYDMLKLENKDKKLIQKLELIICSKDNNFFEKRLRKSNINLIAGVDEVGRGPLVGPVVAACVILPLDYSLDGLTDSKKLSEKKREYFYDEITKQAISIGVGIVSEKVIDKINIYEATKLAMKSAINNCKIKPEHILIDAMPLDLDINTTSIIKGDIKSISISAASVIAKVTRDRMLLELDKKYPMYGFKNNKGYPTKSHLDAIKKYGIIDEHRLSYGPIKDYIDKI